MRHVFVETCASLCFAQEKNALLSAYHMAARARYSSHTYVVLKHRTRARTFLFAAELGRLPRKPSEGSLASSGRNSISAVSRASTAVRHTTYEAAANVPFPRTSGAVFGGNGVCVCVCVCAVSNTRSSLCEVVSDQGMQHPTLLHRLVQPVAKGYICGAGTGRFLEPCRADDSVTAAT